MSVQNKPDYKIFADGAKPGEIVTFPDVLRGWGVTLDTTGGIPPMEFANAVAKRLNEWLMYLTQRGIPEWDAAVDYPKAAMTVMDNVFYVSLKQSKGDNPSTSQQSWKKFTDFFGIDGKLSKDQNGADIPDKPKFIKNLGLPEVMSNLVTGENIPVSADLNNYKTPGDYYQNSSDLAASGKNYPVPYAGHLRVEKAAGVIQIYRHYITGQQWQRSFYDNSWTIWLEFSHIRPGKIELTGFRNGEVDFGWYLMNGDRYPVTSLVGKALLSLSANFRQDWGIVESGGMINIPDIQQADGRTPFLRPINKTGRQVGSVEQDAQRKITGFLHDVYGGNSLSVDGAFDKSAVFETTYYASRTQSDLKFKFIGNCNFDSSSVTQTASENRSLNIGMNAVIYLGV